MQQKLYISYRKKILTILLYIIIDLIISIIIWTASKQHTPELLQKEVLVNSISVLQNADINVIGYNIDGDKYTRSQDENDPKLIFNNIKSDYISLEVVFNDYLSAETLMQVFYPDENGDFTEDNSFIVIGDNKKSDYIFNLPKYASSSLRIDINGDFELLDVRVSQEKSVMIDQEKPSYSKKIFLFVFACNIIICTLKRLIKRDYDCNKHTVSDNNKKINVLKTTAIIACCTLLSIIIGYIISRIVNFHLFSKEIVFLTVLGFSVGIFIAFRNVISNQIEIGFIIIAITFAFLVLYNTCASSYITWDDEIHYQKTLALSYGGAPYITEADQIIENIAYTPYYNSNSNNYYHDLLLNNLYNNGALYIQEYSNVYSITNIAYSHMAYSLIIGRALNLPFSIMFNLGRLANIILYIILCSASIKTVKRGKNLVTLIALLPINLFQACNYTYDSWTFGWILLGICNYIRFIQNDDEKITIHRFLKIVLCVLIGCCSKPVYVPILLMLLAIPKSRFYSEKTRKYYYIFYSGLIVISVIFVLTLLPSLLPIYSDSRGGSDVDAVKQYQFILNNKLYYIGTILKFVFTEYLSLLNSNSYITFTGHYPSLGANVNSTFPGTSIWIIMIIYTAITDTMLNYRKISNNDTMYVKCMLLIGSFVSIFITATVFYLTFTSVGTNSVNGCQGRYLEPILLALLVGLQPRKIYSNYNKRKFTFYMLLICNVLLLIGNGIIAFMTVYI